MERLGRDGVQRSCAAGGVPRWRDGREFGASTSFDKHPFSPAVAAEVLEILDERGVSPCINVDDPHRDIVLGAHPFTHPEYIRRLQGRWCGAEDPWTAVRTLSVLAFTLLGGEPSMIRDLAAQVKARDSGGSCDLRGPDLWRAPPELSTARSEQVVRSPGVSALPRDSMRAAC